LEANTPIAVFFMPTSEDWDDLFWEKAQAAKSARSLDKSVEERDADELIALRNQSVTSSAGALGSLGLHMRGTIPPGAG
jgi:hypothetical protein